MSVNTATATIEATYQELYGDGDVLTLVREDGTEDTALTTRELAALFGITPRRLRRNFRKAGVGCGQGSIYATTADETQAVLDQLVRTNV